MERESLVLTGKNTGNVIRLCTSQSAAFVKGRSENCFLKAGTERRKDRTRKKGCSSAR